MPFGHIRRIAGASAAVAIIAIGGCSFLSSGGGRVPPPDELVFLFTGDTAGELKGCG
jgi:hypothetical protein